MKTEQKVRLSKDYVDTIKKLAQKYFNSEEVRIFGSRAVLGAKGGDIDIYIKTNKMDNILKSKLAFLRDFELIHGEQKVDLIVQNGNEEKKFFREARTYGVSI